MPAQKGKLLAIVIVAVIACAAIGTVFSASEPKPTQSDNGNQTPISTPQPTSNSQEAINNQPAAPSPTQTASPSAVPTGAPANTPTPSASPSPGPQQSFDSGWINITDKAGKSFEVTHNLASGNVNITITGKSSVDDVEHEWQLGSSDLMSGFNRTYSGDENDGAYSIVKAADGGYAILGFTDSAQTWTTQAWLIKVDAEGVMQWNRTYGGHDWGIGQSLVRTADGGYAILANLIHCNTNDYDCWLIKTDANGEPQWNHTYGGIKDDHANSLVQTSDGGYAILGSTQSYGSGKSDFWLVKTDSAGNMQWNQTYGTEANEQGSCLIQTREGGYALAGLGNPTGKAEEYHYWLVKADSEGNWQWDKFYGGVHNEFVCTVVQTFDGGYALAGRSVSLGNRVWLVKTDGYGNMEWNNSYGGPYYNDARGMIQTRDGGFAITGVTAIEMANSGPMWIVKTNQYGEVEKTQVFLNTYSGDCILEDSDGSLVVAGSFWPASGNMLDVLLVKTYLQPGLALAGSTENTVTLYRDISDTTWNYVRVRVTKNS